MVGRRAALYRSTARHRRAAAPGEISDAAARRAAAAGGLIARRHAGRGGPAAEAAVGYRGPSGLASAVAMIRSMRAGAGSPLAAHIIGNPDIGVIPGIVLISLTRTSPSDV
jgi:hypothetical protein